MPEAIIVAIIGTAGVIGAAAIKAYFDFRATKNSLDSDIVVYGAEIGIRVFNGKYVQSKILENGYAQLYALEHHVKLWEIFEIAAANAPFSISPNRPVHFGDKVAFRAKNNGNFVGTKNDSQRKELTADVKHVQEWEIFTILPISPSKIGQVIKYGDSFALQAVNGLQVMYNRDGNGELVATAPHIKAWETFMFVSPANPK